MTDLTPMDQLTPLQKAALVIKELRARLDTAESARTEPIAIIGMACRFPGPASTPEQFWQLLHDGVDAVGDIPPGRWDVEALYDPDPDTPGKMTVRQAAYLPQIDQFDPQFFNISPREAVSLDPQQRLLLMVAWEALERAGQSPDSLRQSPTGVFVGIGQNDYAQWRLFGGEPEQIEAYDGTGNGLCFAAGRISYFLGLQGPNLAIDTACSSSLVAIHLACHSLRLGESRMALAGGVHLTLSPESGIFLSRARALAPDGRSKAFSADADGFGRGEGCGVLVLKRLSDAQANGDPILAVIRGTAVNHDGPGSGLTVPNSLAQSALIRQALNNAGLLTADSIDYIEAHGTGTALGDPIEVEALADVFGGRKRPLFLGSVKTNIGHLEAAAGVAGVIKVVLALQARELPPHLHCQTPNPRIPWASLPFELVKTPKQWPDNGRSRLAGVSSFGMSGTNAHLILEEWPQPPPVPAPSARPYVLPLSAKTEETLREVLRQYQHDLTKRTADELPSVCFTASAGRAHHPWRLAVTADSLPELSGELKTAVLRHSPTLPKIAFLFTGQGSQYVGMGRELYQTEPAFRAAMDECDAILRPYLGLSLLDVLYPEIRDQSLERISQSSISNPQALISHTRYTQPALFALQYALAQLWQFWGILPDVVLGHSVGELAAACVAGVFSLADGLKLAAERGRLMGALPAGGAMTAVFAPEAVVQPFIVPYAGRLSLAAINAPDSVVISGEAEAITAVTQHLAAQNIRTQPLEVSHAFHSPLMQPMLAEFSRIAQTITYHRPRLRFISTVTGQPQSEWAADYWTAHISQPVNFVAGIQTAEKLATLFIEIGPAPTLLALGQRTLPQNKADWLPSLRPAVSDSRQMRQSLAALYQHGAAVEWSSLYQQENVRRVILPTYPFRKEHYLLTRPSPKTAVSPLLNSLLQGKTADFLAALARSGRFTPEQQTLLPQIAELLAQQAQQPEPHPNLFYRLVWQPASRPSTHFTLARWLILGDDLGLAEALRGQGQTAVSGQIDQLDWNEVDGVVFMRGCQETAVSQATPLVIELLSLAQTIAQTASPVKLWVVTHTAQAVDDAPLQVAQSPLWGAGRSLALEMPQQWGGLIDFGGDVADLATELLTGDETQVVLRGNGRFVPRLTTENRDWRVEISSQSPIPNLQSGNYLITGGTGWLGWLAAQWLVAQGAKWIVLASRRGAVTAVQQETITAWRAKGVHVTIAQLDITSEAALARLLAQMQPPLRGVIHAAGVLGHGALQTLTEDEITAVCQPKIAGAWLLHQLTRQIDLNFFITFSSVASVWGSKGQPHYAAANAFLDALAQERHRQGLPALSINWGPWAGGGMVSAGVADLVQKMGLNLLPSSTMQWMHSLMKSSQPQLIVADVAWDTFAPLYALTPQRGMLAHMMGQPKAETTVPPPPLDNLDDLIDLLQQVIGRIMGFQAELPNVTRGFAEMGLDSLMAVQLKKQLETQLNTSLPTTLAFDYPTIESLAAYLAETVLGWKTADSQTTPSAAPEPTPNNVEDSIAVQLARLEFLLRGG